MSLFAFGDRWESLQESDFFHSRVLHGFNNSNTKLKSDHQEHDLQKISISCIIRRCFMFNNNDKFKCSKNIMQMFIVNGNALVTLSSVYVLQDICKFYL